MLVAFKECKVTRFDWDEAAFLLVKRKVSLEISTNNKQCTYLRSTDERQIFIGNVVGVLEVSRNRLVLEHHLSGNLIDEDLDVRHLALAVVREHAKMENDAVKVEQLPRERRWPGQIPASMFATSRTKKNEG